MSPPRKISAVKRCSKSAAATGVARPILLARCNRPQYTGLDLNPTGIKFCQKRHQVAGLDFVQGDAENLPFRRQHL